ncbi:MAG: hypothetical protein WC884_03185 [Candidatus Paceibacterota bacterium]
MQDIVDLLQIKIEKAKTHLSEDTLNAIASVPWQASILQMRETKGYSFDQLSNLEMETELVLCGLLNPEDYPKELESRMKITKAATNELVNEMNSLVFSKIREELIKSTEQKKMFKQNSPLEEYPLGGGGRIIHPGASATPQEGNHNTEEQKKNNMQVLKTHGIEIIPEKLELNGEVIHPILTQKLSSSVQNPSVKTEHTLPNLQPPSTQQNNPTIDPYREIPE